MVTDAGTETADVLLERLATTPFVGAGKSVVIVQISVPAPPIFILEQVNPLRTADCPPDSAAPFPCNFTAVSGPADALLMTLSWPVRSVLSCGLKCTLNVRLLPLARVIGRVPCPSILNAELDNTNWEILAEAVPVFETDTLCTPELPRLTVPKSTSEGVATSVVTPVVPDEDPLK